MQKKSLRIKTSKQTRHNSGPMLPCQVIVY